MKSQSQKIIDKEKLREWINNQITKANGDYQTFDFDVEYSSNLSVYENQRILEEKIISLFPIEKKYTKKNYKSEQLLINNQIKQEIEKLEKQAEYEFENSVSELSKVSEKNKIINESFKIPIEYIKSVARGFNNAFIYLGKQGQGKTTITLKTLESEKVKYVYHSGISTPKALYEFLFENKNDKVIVFDDCVGIINNYYALGIILSALWSTTDVRKVTWNSSRGKVSIPNAFIFNSKIIIITNKIPKNDYAEVVISRCLNYEQKLNYWDIIKIMYAICKDKEVADYIKENSSEFTKNFDLRILKKAEKLKEYSDNWRELLIPMLDKEDEEIKYLKECIKNSMNINEAQKKWSEKYGGRATFFRRKKEYENK